MNWTDLLKELRKNSPDYFEDSHVEVGAKYDIDAGLEVRVAFECDSIIIKFLGKYKNKYLTTVRVYMDGCVGATIWVDENREFSFPVTGQDEYFDERLALDSSLSDYMKNNDLRAELKGIYDWIFEAYCNCNK